MRAAIVISVLVYICKVSAQKCSEPGRFPDASDPECKGYVMCIAAGSDAAFSRYNLTCPANFVFNPIDGVCANPETYNCTDHYTTFVCQEAGNFKNPEKPDCSSFIQCKKFSETVLHPIKFDCSNGTIFDSINRNCIDQEAASCHRDAGHSSSSSSSANNFFVSFIGLLTFIFSLL